MLKLSGISRYNLFAAFGLIGTSQYIHGYEDLQTLLLIIKSVYLKPLKILLHRDVHGCWSLIYQHQHIPPLNIDTCHNGLQRHFIRDDDNYIYVLLIGR
jgi:hypothetical protein